jgi:hypothetical protein
MDLEKIRKMLEAQQCESIVFAFKGTDSCIVQFTDIFDRNWSVEFEDITDQKLDQIEDYKNGRGLSSLHEQIFETCNAQSHLQRDQQPPVGFFIAHRHIFKTI